MEDMLMKVGSYYERNREECLAKAAAYKDKNRVALNEAAKEYYERNKQRILERAKGERQARKAYDADYYRKNKEKKMQYSRDRKKENAEKRRIRDRHNRVQVNKKAREYNRKKRKEDPYFRLSQAIRTRLSIAVKQGVGKKCGRTLTLTGCSWSQLRDHLESQFTEGMTWEKYGKYGWHVDHIKPCSKFDLTIDSEQRACFHYTNLQPLWAKDNLSKGDKYNQK